MLRILIVDDEPLARNRLKRLVDEIESCTVVGEAGSGDEALACLDTLKPQVLLLDISMPGTNGMELAEALQKQANSPAIVFCTAYENQALEAFDHDAVDYLVKPVRKERLSVALNKVKRFLGLDKQNDADKPFLRSSVGGKVALIPVAEVICLLAEDKYTTVIYSGGRTVLDDSLTQLEARYEDYFFRVHRNALIARNRLRGLERNQQGKMEVVLEGFNQNLEISRRKLPLVRQLIKEME